MKQNLFRNSLIISIIVLFVGASIAPVISGVSFKSNTNRIVVQNEIQDSVPLTFYIFDKSGMRQQELLLPKNIAEIISNMFNELKFKFEFDPLGDDTRALLVDFVDLLDLYGLIPEGLSKDYVLSLLNPPWAKFLQEILRLTSKTPFLRGSVLNFLNLYFNVDNNEIKSIFADQQDFITKYVLMSNVASAGTGIPFPFFMLPRPRGIAAWAASDAMTYVGSLIQAEGFIAYGTQQALALGFMGIGISVYMVWFAYALIGYAALLVIRAEDIEYVGPPNKAPIISDEYPVDGSVDVPVSLSELSFRISDGDGDRMSYSVSTSPDIGSGSGNLKKDGVYSVPVSGLEYNKRYAWDIEVSDGKDTTVKHFGFYTEMKPFDPFNEGWQYRKMITIDHDLVDGDLSDFPVLVSVVDVDLRNKVQSDGDDILFMNSSGVANRLFHEIEFFDDSNGELVCWVRFSNLDGDVDSVFYLYYGNPVCDSQQFPDMVWDPNFKIVLHMTGSSHSDLKDSTINNNDINVEGGNPTYSQVGKVGKCVSFDGSGDFLKASSFSLPTDSSHTGTCWIRMPSIEPERRFMFESDTRWSLSLGYLATAFIEAYTQTTGPGTYHTTTNPITISKDNWYFVGTRVDATNNKIIVWLDDSGHNERSFEGSVYSAPGLNIGTYRDNNGRWMEGEIDEIQISNIVRSDAWIKTSFNTMNDPSSFMSFGPEETGP